jgi:hypothetical protein
MKTKKQLFCKGKKCKSDIFMCVDDVEDLINDLI